MFEGTVAEMKWVEAPCLSAADTRRIAVAELCSSLEPVVINAGANEVPASEHPTIVRQVNSGDCQGCCELLCEGIGQREVAAKRLLALTMSAAAGLAKMTNSRRSRVGDSRNSTNFVNATASGLKQMPAFWYDESHSE
jgi:hypothetical protein